MFGSSSGRSSVDSNRVWARIGSVDMGLALALLLCLCVMVSGASSCAAAAYQMVNLGVLDTLASFPSAINNHGSVVGYTLRNSWDRGILWRNGQTIEIGFAPNGALFSDATDVNDNDVVIGYGDSNSARRGFTWEAGTKKLLPTLGGFSCLAQGINNNGWIVGRADGADKAQHACLWVNRVAQVLSAPGQIDPRALDINDNNWIVGSSSGTSGSGERALLWRDGVMTDLGTLGGNNARANAVGPLNHIVGGAENSGGVLQPYVYYNGVMTSLGISPTQYGEASGVNSRGDVVGYSAKRAYLWANGQAIDLNSEIDAPGWTLESAVDINEAGQITCLGRGVNNQLHAVLLTPVPEPSTLVGILAGVGSLAGLFLNRSSRTR